MHFRHDVGSIGSERYFLEYENFYDAAANAFPTRNYVKKHNFSVDFSQLINLKQYAIMH